MTSFIEKLQAAQVTNKTWLCSGLDPVMERMPEALRDEKSPSLPFLKTIVDVTADLVCAYKPNLGFYLSLGAPGIAILEQIIAYIPDEIPVLLDGKFNDIGHTAQSYARGAFDALGADAVTVNPYLGQDGIGPFLARADKAAFVLARTSNPSARDFQDLSCTTAQVSTASMLYENVTRQAVAWNRDLPGTCGLVVGATYPQELAQVRALAPDLPFLIPGIGAQGGSLEATLTYGPTHSGLGPLINASRAILYASSGDDFGDAARRAADELRHKINQGRQ
jgi:orotidine-5'-phosphate decarboxylase